MRSLARCLHSKIRQERFLRITGDNQVYEETIIEGYAVRPLASAGAFETGAKRDDGQRFWLMTWISF